MLLCGYYLLAVEHRLGNPNAHGYPYQTVGRVIRILLFPNTTRFGRQDPLLVLILFCNQFFFYFWPLSRSVYFQDMKGVVSAQNILKKEPVSSVVALKESMKFFDANFFNDSKVKLEYYLQSS
jgi:hypothetical protein